MNMWDEAHGLMHAGRMHTSAHRHNSSTTALDTAQELSVSRCCATQTHRPRSFTAGRAVAARRLHMRGRVRRRTSSGALSSSDGSMGKSSSTCAHRRGARAQPPGQETVELTRGRACSS
jgi:hypothetical protein